VGKSNCRRWGDLIVAQQRSSAVFRRTQQRKFVLTSVGPTPWTLTLPQGHGKVVSGRPDGVPSDAGWGQPVSNAQENQQWRRRALAAHLAKCLRRRLCRGPAPSPLPRGGDARERTPMLTALPFCCSCPAGRFVGKAKRVPGEQPVLQVRRLLGLSGYLVAAFARLACSAARASASFCASL